MVLFRSGEKHESARFGGFIKEKAFSSSMGHFLWVTPTLHWALKITGKFLRNRKKGFLFQFQLLKNFQFGDTFNIYIADTVYTLPECEI